jgi:malate dehydrogenase
MGENMPKIAIIGAGQVGATCAHLAILKNLGDVVLIDIAEGLAAGKALDLMQAAASEGIACKVSGTTDFSAMEGSSFVVITAGLARKPGMSRQDLLSANANIIGPIAEKISKLCPSSIVIVVTNPLDIMTALVLRRSGFEKNRVIGMAGVLDTSRLKAFIASKLNISPAKVSGYVLGSHGDQMVPLKSSIKVGNKPITELLDASSIEALLARTRDAGAEIVSLLKTSSAYYAPAGGVVLMLEAIIKNSHKVMPVSAWLEGEYGLKDVCIGVPAQIGASGIEKIVNIELSPDEVSALKKAAQPVKEGLDWIAKNLR